MKKPLRQTLPPPGLAGVLWAIATVGAGFVVLIWVGFVFHGQRPPQDISNALPWALLVLAVGLVALIRWTFTLLRRRSLTTSLERAANAAPPWRHPDAQGLCLHLAPVESAMRRAGVVLENQHGRHSAACCIDRAHFASAFGPQLAALYTERHDIDRSFHDPKTAWLECASCDSTLHLIHPEQARDETAWFPRQGALHA